MAANIEFYNSQGVLRIWDDEQSLDYFHSVKTRRSDMPYGLSRYGTFWFVDTDNELSVCDTASGKLDTTVRLPQRLQLKFSADNKPGLEEGVRDTYFVNSLDRSEVFVFTRKDTSAFKLITLDLLSLTMTNVCDIPAGYVFQRDITDQGESLLFWLDRREDGIGLVRITKRSQKLEYSSLYNQNPPWIGADLKPTYPSPCGRYWLRGDNQIPRCSIGQDEFFGLSLQVWEAFPLQFKHRQICAWFHSDELEWVRHTSNAVDHLRAISEVLEEHVDSPITDIDRTWFPEPYSSDDALWNQARRVWVGYSKLAPMSMVSEIKWQDDSAAFWVKMGNTLACIGLEGSVSSRLEPSEARRISDFESRNDRAAFVKYYHAGSEVFLGTAQKDLRNQARSPAKTTDWSPESHHSPTSPDVRALEYAHARASIEVPLSSLSNDDIIQAINELCNQITPSLSELNYYGQIFFSFINLSSPEKARLSEKAFFQIVQSRGSVTAAPLRRLIETYCEHITTELFANGDEGEGLLAYAALALAHVDPSSYDLLEDYGDLCDPGHEYVYAKQVAKALLNVEEYDEGRHRYGLRFLIRDFYNSVSAFEIWTEYGLGEAAKRHFKPETYAKIMISAAQEMHEDYLKGSEYGAQAYDVLLEELFDEPEVPSAWEKKLFTHLRSAQKTQ